MRIRRIVTGHDTSKLSKVIWDGHVFGGRQLEPASVTTLIWSTDGTPADISVGENVMDMGEGRVETRMVSSGTRFIIVDFKPGISGFKHRTETIDYVVVISGEIDLDLDDTTVKLNAGDVAVQRGTNHAWSNRGTQPARLAFTQIDAKPLGIGEPVIAGDEIKQTEEI